MTDLSATRKSIKPSLVIFYSAIAVFALIIVDGYVLSFLNLALHPAAIFILVSIELGTFAIGLYRSRARIGGDPLEVLGFLLIVAGTWLNVLYPSWPTLLPPSFSGDAPNHLAYVNSIFSTGRIFGDYPGGPALIAAMLAHWMGVLPVYVLHPLGAFWLALTAGGIYGIACAMLPERREYKVLAWFAVFALFIQWAYFGGILTGMHYFWTQAAGQLFIVAFVWFLHEHLESPGAGLAIGMALCLIALDVSFQLWLALPVALLGWMALRRWRKRETWPSVIFILTTLALWLGAILLTGGRYTSTLDRLKGDAPAMAPTFAAFGGIFLVLPILGIVLGLRRQHRAELEIAFLVLAALQTLALEGAHLWMDVGSYWVNKSFFVWIFPLALLSILPLAYLTDYATRFWKPSIVAAAWGVGLVLLGIYGIATFQYPLGSAPPIGETDLQVALWAKAHLDTGRVHYVGAKNIIAQWLGVGFWNEKYPDDLFDFAALGPKTFEEWRDDPGWGEYLFVSSSQHLPVDPTLRVLVQQDGSAIVQKPPVRQNPIAAPEGHFADLLMLADYAVPSSSFHAGDVIPLNLHVETLRIPAHRVVWWLQLRDAQGHAVADARVDPFQNKYPLQRWPNGMTLTQPLALPLSIDVRPGLYDLQLGLYEVRSGKAVPFQSAEGIADDVIHLAQIKVALPPVTSHELAATNRMSARVGNAFELIGYRLKKNSPIRAGDSFQVILYWRALAHVPESYTVFMHLLNASGELKAQVDSAPRNGTYPTTIWGPDETIVDSYRLTVPRDAAPGDYRIELGMYQYPSLKRLPVTASDAHGDGDHIVLPVVIEVRGDN